MKAMMYKISRIKEEKNLGYWGERVLLQLEYARQMSKYANNKYDELINEAICFVDEKYTDEGTLTKETSMEAESIIKDLTVAAKKYKLICIGHAHIDISWFWGWDETVAITLDTFRTILGFMNEYPDFKFSQSQALVYKIVEEYDPEMLEEIKKRVQEGRWEVTASTWVEADKNMPNGESMARHILYTKRYLSNLLGIKYDSLNIDFEPDTFGHSINVPEILNRGGIKYYYHCRAFDDYHVYRWIAPSGSSLIVYREPSWYNKAIEPSMVLSVPEFCSRYRLHAKLELYGVGNHGGGPTRRDLECMIDMDKWPVFPEIKFGTLGEYFSLLEKNIDKLPEIRGELNFLFTGCYTSQSRIKMANRKAEAVLNETEAYSAIESLVNGRHYPSKELKKAWQNVLFNQFHDIIGGTGSANSREYSMGLFQNTMASANTRKSMALRNIAANIDTRIFQSGLEKVKESTSEGAGVGFGLVEFKISQVDRGRGKTRIFHVFNPSSTDRDELAEIVAWDWEGDVKKICFRDGRGNSVDHQFLDTEDFPYPLLYFKSNNYWMHKYYRFLIRAKIPAWGYRTYILSENPDWEEETQLRTDPRVEKEDEFILENEHIKVTFHSHNASIVSMVDKKTGKEFVDTQRIGGVFRFIEEEGKGMTAWIVGRYMRVENITENVKIKKTKGNDYPLRNAIHYEMGFKNSHLDVTVSLDHNSPHINYSVECDWYERGRIDISIPQLSFFMPLWYECLSYKYDVPFGTIERKEMDLDVPANSWALGVRKESKGKSLMIITDSKYGFRCINDSISVTLIRSSYDPAPYPEVGIHRFNFSLCLTEASNNKLIIENAYNYSHPFNVISSTIHNGALSPYGHFITLEKGSIAVSAIKYAEEQTNAIRLVVRVYETENKETDAALRFFRKPKRAYYSDVNEIRIDNETDINVKNESIYFKVSASCVATICVEFEKDFL